tara:strand:- start:847 stop:1056 length:210 start_codon:yes stop_codon:yes gene_type:complete
MNESYQMIQEQKAIADSIGVEVAPMGQYNVIVHHNGVKVGEPYYKDLPVFLRAFDIGVTIGIIKANGKG